MKVQHQSYLFLLGLLLVAVACKKDKFTEPTGELEAKDYVYNVALKGFQPQATVGGHIATNFELRTIYYYIQRASQADSLIQIDFLQGEQEYDFSIKPAVWSNINLAGVSGLKLLCVRDNNTSLEKVVKMSYFNPAAPVLKNIPATITPALTGTTAITGKATSETGINKVYFYDNRSGNFAVMDSVAANSSKDFAINYNYTYATGAGQLKVTAVDIYGLKAEQIIQFVNIPFKPVISFDADTLRTALPDGKPVVSGTLKSYTALSAVELYVVKAGGETLQGTIIPTLVNNTANEYNYTFSSSSFPYADDVTGCKLVAKDATNSSNNGSVPVKILPYYRWNNITMTAQGLTGTNAAAPFFLGEPATPTLSACAVVNDASMHAKVDFAIFCNSTPLIAFNNPANISAATLTTFKCDGVSWAPATPTANTLKKTLFRVLATSVAETGIYTKYGNNTITDLSDAFFTGVSAPSANAPNSTTFSTTSLIYAKVTPAGGTGATKNLLIKVQSVNVVAVPNQASSTITMDILKEK
jgi:hypothetical protein